MCGEICDILCVFIPKLDRLRVICASYASCELRILFFVNWSIPLAMNESFRTRMSGLFESKVVNLKDAEYIYGVNDIKRISAVWKTE